MYRLKSNDPDPADRREYTISAAALNLSPKLVQAVRETNIPPNSERSMVQLMIAPVLARVVLWCERHASGNNIDAERERRLMTARNRRRRMALCIAASTLRIEGLRQLSIELFCEQEESEESETIAIASDVGDVYRLSVEAAKQSRLLGDILRTLGRPPSHPIPTNISGFELELAVRYMEHYKGKPIPRVIENELRRGFQVAAFDRQILAVPNINLVRAQCCGHALEINGLIRSSTRLWIEIEPRVSMQEKQFIFTNLQ